LVIDMSMFVCLFLFSLQLMFQQYLLISTPFLYLMGPTLRIGKRT
jgi:hypothetical protein